MKAGCIYIGHDPDFIKKLRDAGIELIIFDSLLRGINYMKLKGTAEAVFYEAASDLNAAGKNIIFFRSTVSREIPFFVFTRDEDAVMKLSGTGVTEILTTGFDASFVYQKIRNQRYDAALVWIEESLGFDTVMPDWNRVFNILIVLSLLFISQALLLGLLL